MPADRNEVALVLRTMAESYRILAMSCDRAAEMLEAGKKPDTKIEPVIKFRE